RLERLRDRARFRVVVNLVLCERTREDFRAMVDTVAALGLPLTVGLVHDDKGGAAIRGDDYVTLYRYYEERFGSPHFVEFDYGLALLRGEQPEWRCRARATSTSTRTDGCNCARRSAAESTSRSPNTPPPTCARTTGRPRAAKPAA